MFRVIVIILLLFATNVNALQIKALDLNHRLVFDISQDSINRIAIEHDRIAQVFGLNEDLVIESDNNTGQIFLRTKQTKAIDLSIITEKHVTLDLRLQPKSIPGETIIIKTNKPNEPYKINAKTTNYLEQITTLMLAMANTKTLASYTLTQVHKQILLWDKIDLVQTSEYLGNNLIGETYTLTNKTKNRLFLTETQFGWQKKIAGVAIKKHALAPNEKNSNLYYKACCMSDERKIKYLQRLIAGGIGIIVLLICFCIVKFFDSKPSVIKKNNTITEKNFDTAANRVDFQEIWRLEIEAKEKQLQEQINNLNTVIKNQQKEESSKIEEMQGLINNLSFDKHKSQNLDLIEPSSNVHSEPPKITKLTLNLTPSDEIAALPSVDNTIPSGSFA